MAQAKITLKEQDYSIACAPGQETHLESLGRELDARLGVIESAVGDVGRDRLILISALALLDELRTQKASRQAISGDIEAKMSGVLLDAAARISAIAGRVESLDNGAEFTN